MGMLHGRLPNTALALLILALGPTLAQSQGQNPGLTATTQTAEDDTEIMPGYSYRKLRQMKFEDVSNLGKEFQDLYVPNVSRSVKWSDIEISAEEYSLGDPDDGLTLRGADFLPDGILVLRAKGKQAVLPMEWAPYAKDRAYLVGHAPAPVLCIDNGSGGNGWNANPSHIVSMADDTLLKNLGEISASQEGGKIDLIKVDDVWESRLPWLSHANSPGATVHYRVVDGRLEPDQDRNEAYWKAQIEELDQEIAKLHEGVKKDPNAKVTLGPVPDNRDHNLLETILTKFLNQRLLLGHEKAWAALQAELRHLDGADFYWAAQGRDAYTTYRYPINKIEPVLTETLQKAGQWPIQASASTQPQP